MYFFSRRQVKELYIKKKIDMTEEVKKERLLRYRKVWRKSNLHDVQVSNKVELNEADYLNRLLKRNNWSKI